MTFCSKHSIDGNNRDNKQLKMILYKLKYKQQLLE